jgi:hypothetical protein
MNDRFKEKIEKFMNIFRIQPKDIKLLLKQVRSQQFLDLLTGSELINVNQKIIFKVSISDVKRLDLNNVVSNLIFINAAVPMFEQKATILEYVMVYSDYEKIIEKKISQFGDFKQLNHLLGENDKLSRIADLVNKHSILKYYETNNNRKEETKDETNAETKDETKDETNTETNAETNSETNAETTENFKIVIPFSDIRDNDLVLDFMALNSLNLVHFKDGNIEIEPEFCLWLIEYRNRQNYKITFLDIYSETI